ncbi:MAG: hypothetical protein IJL73_04615 [Lachnospiraceae bacterium]|nr:hypothetical protein [Lachnospiraceae bacterium]
MKRLHFIICMILLLCLASCRSSESPSGSSEKTIDPGTISAADSSSATEAGMEFYLGDTVANKWYYKSRILSTSQGFYDLRDDRICFVGNESGRIILCGKPDCRHNDSSCDAYLKNAGDFTLLDGHIYYMDVDRWEIGSMLPDGTGRKTVIPAVAKIDQNEELGAGFLFYSVGFHNNYYFCDASYSTYSYSVENDANVLVETIHELLLMYDVLKPVNDPVSVSERIYKTIYSSSSTSYESVSGDIAGIINSIGNQLYLSAFDGDPLDQECKRRIDVYSLSDGTRRSICSLPAFYNVWAFPDGNIYYSVLGEGIWSVPIDGGDGIQILSFDATGWEKMDEQYIYVLLGEALCIYDHDGMLLNRLPLTKEMVTQQVFVCGKCGNRLLFRAYQGSSKRIRYSLDYSKIGDPSLELEEYLGDPR